MLKRNRMMGGMLLAFALLGSQMARADEEKPVSLLTAPKVGQVNHIKTIIKTNAAGMDLVVTQSQKNTIKEIKANGDVVLEIADEGTVVDVGGQEMEQPPSPPRTITRDKVGKVKEVKFDDAGQFMSPEVTKIMAGLSSAILTEKAVKTNDTWQTELDNPAVKEKKITVKDTYLGLDKVDGKDYWKIKQTAEAIVDADGAKMSYEIIQWINPATGDMLKVEGTIKDVPTQVGNLTMQISSKSVKGEEKAKPEPAKP